jgi:TonB-linked SusC/RagA family outer membrane protein
VRWWSRAARGAALLGVSVPAALAAQATLTGHVTATGGSQPLADVRVLVVGSPLAASTNAQGVYTIRGAPSTAIEVRVIRVGYREQKKSVTPVSGQTTTLDFDMTPVVVQLQELVTTATGEQRKVELGNTVSTLGDVSARVATGTATSIPDMLVAKAPGVVVLPGSQTGTAGTIRIRGVSSLSLGNAPIWVVDGVRFNAGSVGLANGTSGQATSMLNGLDPETIEDIEIVKGPSAATLYGTDAANGVIVVTTKKGRAGAARWTWFGEGGLVQDRNHYLDTYAIWGHTPANPGTQTRCVLTTVASGACVKDSVTSLNPLSDPNLTPFANGHRDQYGVQVSGGNEALRYFISGDVQNEMGPIKMPQHDIDRFAANDVAVRDESIHPENLQAQNIRVNLNATINPKLDLSVNAGFVKTNQRVTFSDNSFWSLQYQAMMSPGFAQPGLNVTQRGTHGEDLMGNNGFTFGDIMQYDKHEDIQRLLGSVSANWRPLPWMQNDATIGLDFADLTDISLCRLGECPDQGTLRTGTVSSSQSDNRNFSAKVSSNSSWQARSWANVKSTIGADYVNVENNGTNAASRGLPPGAITVGQGAIVTSAGNTLPTANKTLGLYIQEQVALRDRLFLTVAARTDQNSAFGTNFQRVIYPKASASWLASDESFFPHFSWLNQFRVRGSYGASGVQPGATSSFVTYSAPTVSVPSNVGATSGTDTPGLRANSLGNSELKPERATEFEGGFDSHMFDNRVNVEFTYYSKQTRDALYNLQIAPSAASSATTVLRNLGSIKNTGLELLVNATLIDRRQFGMDVTVSGSHNNNKVVSLGVDASGNPNPANGTGSTRDSVGLPVRGLFYHNYTYADANGDGYISVNEVNVDTAFTYMGSSIPRDNAAITAGFDFFGHKLRIQGMFDYKGGYSIYNGGAGFQCQQNAACAGLSNPNASLDEQAAAVAATGTKTTTTLGYLENGQFWRFRELSASLEAPARVAHLVRASTANLSFGARNLHVWTSFRGTDPEENYGTGDVQTTFASPAPRTYFTLRLNLHY